MGQCSAYDWADPELLSTHVEALRIRNTLFYGIVMLCLGLRMANSHRSLHREWCHMTKCQSSGHYKPYLPPSKVQHSKDYHMQLSTITLVCIDNSVQNQQFLCFFSCQTTNSTVSNLDVQYPFYAYIRLRWVFAEDIDWPKTHRVSVSWQSTRRAPLPRHTPWWAILDVGSLQFRTAEWC